MVMPLIALLVLLAASPAESTQLRLDDTSAIELEAHWEPLTDTVYGFERRYPICQGWRPAAERASYKADDFRPFLSPAPSDVAVGDCWRLQAADFLPFLRQFHVGATVSLHHSTGAPGAWACLRAIAPQHVEVVMRVHAEFVLEGDGTHGRTSWLTPAQYEGRMIVERGRVASFSLALPDQSANVDLNVADQGRVSADIGRIARMELVGRDGDAVAPAWEQSISIEEIRRSLARAFYRFADIEWLSLADGLAASLE